MDAERRKYLQCACGDLEDGEVLSGEEEFIERNVEKRSVWLRCHHVWVFHVHLGMQLEQGHTRTHHLRFHLTVYLRDLSDNKRTGLVSEYNMFIPPQSLGILIVKCTSLFNDLLNPTWEQVVPYYFPNLVHCSTLKSSLPIMCKCKAEKENCLSEKMKIELKL